MASAPKFSFSFKKVVKTPTVAPVSDKIKSEDNFKDDTPITEFVHAIDGEKIHGDGTIEESKKKKEYVIPLIQVNKYNIKRKRPDDDETNNDVKVKDEIKTEIKEETVEEVTPLSKEESLIERAKRELIEDGRGAKEDKSEAWKSMIINKPPSEYENDNKLDVSIRPPEPTIEDYSVVPVEAFGAALLRGMGWKEGEAIGGVNKAVVPVFEPKVRARGLGLGTEKALKRQMEPPTQEKK